MKKYIRVVGGIILRKIDNQFQILCALRSPKMSLPNLWEFPGGKIEEGESIKETIEREIKEELGCSIVATNSVFDITHHHYKTFNIELITVFCKIVEGEPTPLEHTALQWLPIESLESLVWAPADINAIDQLMSLTNEEMEEYFGKLKTCTTH